MKQVLIIALLYVLFSGCCKKNPTPSELSKLPPETQEGKGTFGCLVNGKAFLPKGSPLGGPIIQAHYQFIYSPSPTGYILGIVGRDRSGEDIYSVSVGFDSLSAQQGRRYLLDNLVRGNAAGRYSFFPLSGSEHIYQTSSVYRGELWLKRFDLTNQIAAGTFWFTAVNPNGDTVKITDGRFDVRFTR